MPRAISILRQKLIDERGNILEVAVWRVPVSRAMPAGVRYRLAFVRVNEETPAVLYDNHAPKGDHRHVEGHEGPYSFESVEQLFADFMRDVGWLRR